MLKRRRHPHSLPVVPAGWVQAAAAVLLLKLDEDLAARLLHELLAGLTPQADRAVEVVDHNDVDSTFKCGAFFGAKEALQQRLGGGAGWRTDSWSLACVGEASLHTRGGEWVCSTYRNVFAGTRCLLLLLLLLIAAQSGLQERNPHHRGFVLDDAGQHRRPQGQSARGLVLHDGHSVSGCPCWN